MIGLDRCPVWYRIDKILIAGTSHRSKDSNCFVQSLLVMLHGSTVYSSGNSFVSFSKVMDVCGQFLVVLLIEFFTVNGKRI